MGEEGLNLPIIDLSTPDRFSTSASIRDACIEFGFFYIVNHGLEKDSVSKLFNESKRFFSLPLEDKLKVCEKENRGYIPQYAHKLDISSSQTKGDSRESFNVGRLDDEAHHLNQWPSQECLPNWRSTLETCYEKFMIAAKSLLSLIALALNLDENHFKSVGAFDKPLAFFRIIHYPGENYDKDVLGASAHSDYGFITLLATDGVPGLQICRNKDQQPRVWEDVPHVQGALVVNLGDMTERMTNCLFRSALHRVVSTGQDRYSAAFFFVPPEDFLVECLESCCGKSNPPRYSPITSGDYLKELFRLRQVQKKENQSIYVRQD